MVGLIELAPEPIPVGHLIRDKKALVRPMPKKKMTRGECDRSDRSGSGRRADGLFGVQSLQPKLIMNSPKLSFHDDHLLVEDGHGSFLHFGRGAGHAGDLAHEVDVVVNAFAHGIDAVQAFFHGQRVVRGRTWRILRDGWRGGP
ncbi:MAG: hypothetical protein EXR98_21060 [Gemmataceae bacterium]|nr:hypothetical protein [Gemmataceae bacterium]